MRGSGGEETVARSRSFCRTCATVSTKRAITSCRQRDSDAQPPDRTQRRAPDVKAKGCTFASRCDDDKAALAQPRLERLEGRGQSAKQQQQLGGTASGAVRLG